MPNVVAPGVASASPGQPDHNFAPDFAIAAVGGLVALGVCAVLYTAFVTWGGLHLDLTVPAGVAAPLSAFPRGLTAIFLSGALVVLIARTLSARTG